MSIFNKEKNLIDMRALLSQHNADSPYKEGDIHNYLKQHFVYIEDEESPPSQPTSRKALLDWQQKEVILAKIISHLPRFAQIILIETGTTLKLHRTNASARQAYNLIFNDNNDTLTGFFDDGDNTVHWSQEDTDATTSLLHELGHAIDFNGHGRYESNKIKYNFKNITNAYLDSEVEQERHQTGINLAAHLSWYEADEYPRETVAELFAEWILLQWLYQYNPPQVTTIMEEKYPDIWPIMESHYIPALEQKAAQLYKQDHPTNRLGTTGITLQNRLIPTQQRRLTFE